MKSKLVNSGLSQPQQASACIAFGHAHSRHGCKCLCTVGGRITACFAHTLFFVNHICAKKEKCQLTRRHVFMFILLDDPENVLLFDQA